MSDASFTMYVSAASYEASAILTWGLNILDLAVANGQPMRVGVSTIRVQDLLTAMKQPVMLCNGNQRVLSARKLDMLVAGHQVGTVLGRHSIHTAAKQEAGVANVPHDELLSTQHFCCFSRWLCTCGWLLTRTSLSYRNCSRLPDSSSPAGTAANACKCQVVVSIAAL